MTPSRAPRGAAPPGLDVAALFDDVAPGLFQYVARRIGASRADDVVSETFLVAFRSRRTYDPDRATPRTWVYGIATNLIRAQLRLENRQLELAARVGGMGDRSVPGPDEQVTDRLVARHDVARLAGAIAALEPRDRDVLLLTAWAGLSSIEIAAALDIPVGTVRSRLHRARTQLRGCGEAVVVPLLSCLNGEIA